MSERKVDRIILAPEVLMGKTPLRQPLPYSDIDQIDPFLLLHHMGPELQKPGHPGVLEVGAHPHRGFEPVTFVFEGEVHHRDSRGNDSKIKAGGVQWMTAGMGIVHSEMASQEFIQSGGPLEIIQLWINLPSKLKMIQPRYQGYQKEDIPTIEDNGIAINVISGSYNDIKGPVESITDITAYTINHKDKGETEITVPPSNHILLYQLNGRSKINGVETGDHKMVSFKGDGEHIKIEGVVPGKILLVHGAPLHEKVVQHGPFVMNDQTEILRAMRDYQMGKMGVLI